MLAVLATLLAVAAALPTNAPDAPPQQASAYDVDALLVPLTRAGDLARLLAQHKSIRLEAGDYTAACARTKSCVNLTLTSGMSIHGLPGTRVPTVVVQPGSTGILLSMLEIAGLLYFPAAAGGEGAAAGAATSHCSFFHAKGCHVLFEGAVSNLQFVGLTDLGAPERPRDQSKPYTVGGIHVAAGASVTNCRFVRCMVHAPWPTFTVAPTAGDGGLGDFRRNTILWENSLGAMQATCKHKHYTLISITLFFVINSHQFFINLYQFLRDCP